MGNMADEIRQRIEADGGAGLATPQEGAAGGVPGSEGNTQPPQAPPAAEPSTTETGPGSGPPESIPYARFKEVNDRLASLKDYETLQQYGYDPDSLGRLAAFEAQYARDPIGVMKSMVDNLDLPDQTREAIKQSFDSVETPVPGSAEGEPSNQAPKPAELPPEVQERLKYVDQLRERDAQAERDRQLDAVVAAWDRLDAQANLKSPSEMAKLTAISGVLSSGQTFGSADELAQAARQIFVDYRTDVLGDAVQGTRQAGSPPALPGSPPVAASPVKFKDFSDASKAAKAAIERGELPPLIGA